MNCCLNIGQIHQKDTALTVAPFKKPFLKVLLRKVRFLKSQVNNYLNVQFIRRQAAYNPST